MTCLNNPLDIYDSLLVKFDVTVPEYLKSLLMYSGFDNILSISKMGNEDLENLEHFAKTVLSRVLDDDQKKKLFGIYMGNIDLFKISDGHRKIISCLQEEAKKIIEIKSLPKPLDLTDERSEEQRRCPTGSRHSQKNSADKVDAVPSADSSAAHIKLLVKNYISRYLREAPKNNIFINPDLIEEIMGKLTDLKVEITSSENARITCLMCNFKSSAYLVKNSSKGKKWVVSNFLKHFKIHFKENKHEKRTTVTAKQTHSDNRKSQPSNLLGFVTINSKSNAMVNNPVVSLVDDADFSSSQGSFDNNITSNITIVDVHRSNEEGSGNSYQEYNNLDSNPLTEHFVLPIVQTRSIIDQETSSDENMLIYTSQDLELIENEAEEFFSTSSTVEKADCSARNHSPPSSKTNLNVTSDSRHLRQMRKWNELPHNQPKITNFISVISKSVEENKEVYETISLLRDNKVLNKDNLNIKGFLERLYNTAIENSNKKTPNRNRFISSDKRFWLYIFLNAGRMAYEVLYSNLKNIMPSISTLNRQMEETDCVKESELQLTPLNSYLEKRNYPKIVFISEDQTALVPRVQYDVTSNKLIGFVGDRDVNGFPSTEKFMVENVKTIENAFANDTIACNAYVYMAQPLVENAPGFCLGIFGSDNKFTHQDVAKRWRYIEEKAGEMGLHILGFSSDGDTRCLKTMKLLSRLPSVESDNPYKPFFQVDYNMNVSSVIQDTVHIATKLKTRLLNDKISLKIGNKTVSAEHIRALIQTVSKDQHLLCESVLEGQDKMNYEAIDRMSNNCVIEHLTKIPEAEATSQYLLLTRYVLDAFLDKTISPEERVYKIWYVAFFLRAWRNWITEQKLNVQNNFITSNTYTCIELNAHGLVMLIDKLRIMENPNIFTPWLFSSQPCEKLFRQTRAMTSTLSTVVNFSLLDMLRRLRRIQVMNEITADLEGEYKFPRENHTRFGNKTGSKYVHELPSTDQLLMCILKAKSAAENTARTFGIEPSDISFTQIKITSVTQNICNPTTSTTTLLDDNCDDIEVAEDLIQNTCNIADTPPETSQIALGDDELNQELENDEHLSVLNSYDSLNLKDFTGTKSSNDKAYLTILLNNNKKMTIKKSTLCWFFSNQKVRLSSDRVLRVRGAKMEKLRKKHTKPTNQTNKKSAKSEAKSLGRNMKRRPRKRPLSETDQSSDSCISDMEVQSEFEIESEPDNDYSDNYNSPSLNIELESYYSVYYDETWHIGRIVEKVEENFKIKFLKRDLDNFIWPKPEDLQIVPKNFIFYGPVFMKGYGPFSIQRHDYINIQKTYKKLKQSYNKQT